MADESLKTIVTELETLPAVPASQEALMAMLQKPEASAKEVGRAIGRDVAMIAKKIAVHEGVPPKEAQTAYMAGLLHDIGKLVFAVQKPTEYAEALAVTRSERLSTEEAEQRVIGASHSQIGGYLLGLWTIECLIVDAAIFHHCPSRHDGSGFSVLTAVHVANVMVHQDRLAHDEAPLHVDLVYLDRIGLGDRWTVWRNTCGHVREISTPDE